MRIWWLSSDAVPRCRTSTVVFTDITVVCYAIADARVLIVLCMMCVFNDALQALVEVLIDAEPELVITAQLRVVRTRALSGFRYLLLL
jgi:hypothetical protein